MHRKGRGRAWARPVPTPSHARHNTRQDVKHAAMAACTEVHMAVPTAFYARCRQAACAAHDLVAACVVIRVPHGQRPETAV